MQYHKIKLEEANKNFNRLLRYPKYNDIEDIKFFLKCEGIPCIKYKHSLSEKVRENESTLCTLKLSENGKKLLLYNKKEIVPVDF